MKIRTYRLIFVCVGVLLMVAVGLEARSKSAKKDALAPPADVSKKAARDQELMMKAEEAEWAASALSAEKEKLETEVVDLRMRVKELTVSLAEAMAELDAVNVSREMAPITESHVALADEGLTRTDIRLADVNADLNMVVLNAGSLDGVKLGMKFTILRENRAAARVRVVDVRDRMAGAVVEKQYMVTFPEKEDRVMMGREREEE